MESKEIQVTGFGQREVSTYMLDYKTAEALGYKKPYRWDNQVRTVLDQARNFVVAHGGSTPGTWATEEAVNLPLFRG